MFAGRGEMRESEGWGRKERAWSWAAGVSPPFPHGRRTGEARSSGLWPSLAGIEIRRKERRKTPQNFLKVIQVRPTGREFHDHATGRFMHPRGDFDQPRAPHAGLAFAERIALAAAVVPMRGVFGRQALRRERLRSTGPAADRRRRDACGPRRFTPPCADRGG